MKRTTIAASILALAAVAHPAAAQDLAAVAAQPAVIADARTSPDGCAVRVLPDGGFMVFATGSGTYDFGNDESDVANARKAAQLAARANLAKFMKESVSTAGGLEEATKSVKRLSASNGAQSVEIDKEMAQKTMQTIRASADALLQGVATLSEAKVPGTGSGGEVRVVCGVSSKTLEARNRLGAALGEAKPEPPPAAPVAPAPASTQAPVVRSTLPAVDLLAVPDGVAVLLPPEGGFLVLSAATAAYDFGDPDDTIQAKNNAEALAKAELAKFMKEKLATESSLDESAGMVKRMSAKDGGESSTIDKNAARKTLQTIRTSADALLQGVATYADANIPGQGKGGEMRVLVGVSSKTMDALDQLKNAWGMSRPAPAPAQPAAQAAAPAAAPATPEAPAQDDWIQCIGTGKSRPDAIRAALVEGVSMVFGTQISQDVRLQSRFKTLKEGDKTTAIGESKAESETISATAGFVKQYRVVEVRELSGGVLEATLRALLVNPRSNTAKAVLVMPTGTKLADKTKVFQTGPKTRLTGADLAAKLNGELANALSAANRFVVMTPASLATAEATLDVGKAMVDGGLTPGASLLNACEALTADYVLGSAFDSTLWTSKLGLDKATGRFSPQRKLTVRVRLALTDVRAARAVADDTVSVSLDEGEIGMLLAEDEDADLLFYALKKIAPTIEEWIANVK